MTNEQIKQIALANGFKLKEQPDGNMDLNPCVYDFARALIAEYQQSPWINVADALPDVGSTVVVIYSEYGDQYVDIAEVMQDDDCHDSKPFFNVCMGNRWQIHEEVTYWQPLPKRPAHLE